MEAEREPALSFTATSAMAFASGAPEGEEATVNLGRSSNFVSPAASLNSFFSPRHW